MSALPFGLTTKSTYWLSPTLERTNVCSCPLTRVFLQPLPVGSRICAQPVVHPCQPIHRLEDAGVVAVHDSHGGFGVDAAIGSPGLYVKSHVSIRTPLDQSAPGPSVWRPTRNQCPSRASAKPAGAIRRLRSPGNNASPSTMRYSMSALIVVARPDEGQAKHTTNDRGRAVLFHFCVAFPPPFFNLLNISSRSSVRICEASSVSGIINNHIFVDCQAIPMSSTLAGSSREPACERRARPAGTPGRTARTAACSICGAFEQARYGCLSRFAQRTCRSGRAHGPDCRRPWRFFQVFPFSQNACGQMRLSIAFVGRQAISTVQTAMDEITTPEV